ncbi:MAG: lytic transglycosylase domain-containing protein [Eubacteriales bacterium]
MNELLEQDDIKLMDELEIIEEQELVEDLKFVEELNLSEDYSEISQIELADEVELMEEIELGEPLGIAEELDVMEGLGIVEGLELIQEKDLIGEEEFVDLFSESEEETTLEFLKEKYKYMNKYNKSMAFIVVLGVVLITLVIVFCVSLFLFQDSMVGMVAENNELVMKSIVADMEREEIEDAFEEVAEALIEASTVNAIINNENELLIEACQSKDEIIQVYETREVLLDLYEHAIMDSTGKRTDIKYDDIIMLENLVEEKEMSEDVVSLILAIAMTESGGNQVATNSESTAVGLGQFLLGTGDFVYSSLMNGEYYIHNEMAANSTINLSMMVYYIEYLAERTGGDIDSIINSYRGLDSPTYKARINYYLAKSDLSLDTIQIK